MAGCEESALWTYGVVSDTRYPVARGLMEAWVDGELRGWREWMDGENG